MGSKLPDNLPQLQNLIKRDPESYRDEFESQYAYYVDTREIFKLSPDSKDMKFYDLVMFLAQVAQCYPKDDDLREFPNDIVSLLRTHGPVLHPEVRRGLVKALILLRNKDLLPPMLLLDVCFDLLRCQDKSLRRLLQLHIITDIKNINAKSKNMVLNRQLQDFLNRKLSDNHAVAVKTALDVMIDLYKKGVWRDKRNVNIIAQACYSKVAKIMVTAIKFFVGNDEGVIEESSDSESEGENNATMKKALLAIRVNKRTKRKQKKVDGIKKTLQETQKKKNKNLIFDYSALHYIHDPQSLAEKIFKIFNKRNERFEVKLLMMNIVSRLIGIHQLYLPNFYPTLQRFLFPHQREVTKIMAYAAQAAHPLVPPDDLQPVLQALAHNFVTERYSPEVMAMGLNAIRELCSRNIHAMNEDLLQDLVGYRNNKNKGVYTAARSLMALYRVKNPHLLAKKTRGVPTELLMEEKPTQFGENTAKHFIPGAEILSFQTRNEDFKPAQSDCEEDEEEERADDDESNSNVEDEQASNDADETIEGEEEHCEEGVAVDEDGSCDEEDESEEYDSDCDGDLEAEKEEEGELDCLRAKEVSSKTRNKKIEERIKKLKPKKESNQKPLTNKAQVLSKKAAIRAVLKLTPEERAAKAFEIVSSRFLTDEDYAKIEAVKVVKQTERFRNKRPAQDDENTERGKLEKERPTSKRQKMENFVDTDREFVALSSIEMIYKKRPHDKASRMQQILENRETRDKFGSKKGRLNPFASTTNREKSKGKSYDMIKHKKRFAKMKTSFKDKKERLKKSLLRQLKNS
ncbi:SDA1 domain [Trinorchestia longiramus]|nr:SDA1 domain [Trinorchestia longiramus]